MAENTYATMKNTLFVLACLLLAGSCIKKPDYRPATTYVTYSFEGGKDMDALFGFTASYTGDGNRTVSERIASLPWTKQVAVVAPFDARLEVAFEARSPMPAQELYEVGFRGRIGQATQPQTAPAATTPRGEETEVLRFSVAAPDDVDPQSIDLSIAPLKYDKHFAFSYTVDDSHVEAYSRIWCRIHGKWIDDNPRFHTNTAPSTGSRAANTLSMTDGCGNERRFGFGTAIWATDGNKYSPDGFITDDDPHSNYLSWADLREIVDWGVGVYYHNVNRQVYDELSPASIAEGFETDRQKVLRELGIEMKTLALPDGKSTYIEAAGTYAPICFIRTSLNRPGEYVKPKVYLTTAGSLYKQQTYDGIFVKADKVLEELAAQSASESPYLVCLTTHTPSPEVVELLATIRDTYGQGGADNLWVASFDEIYEYQQWRTEAAIHKSVEGSTAVFEVTLPAHPQFRFRELSFLITGTDGDRDVQPLSDNIYGLSHAAHGEGMLLNLDFNPALPVRAEKYTARYEASGLDDDKDDARYILSFLRPDLAAPFLDRLDHTPPPVTLSGITINDGANTVYNPLISVAIDASASATAYRIGETADLSAQAWQEFDGSAVAYTLSEGYGSKTIYVQVSDGKRQSAVASATVRYADVPESGTIDPDAAKAYQAKYDGYTYTVSKSITVSK